jgi:hypothetical protein
MVFAYSSVPNPKGIVKLATLTGDSGGRVRWANPHCDRPVNAQSNQKTTCMEGESVLFTGRIGEYNVICNQTSFVVIRLHSPFSLRNRERGIQVSAEDNRICRGKRLWRFFVMMHPIETDGGHAAAAKGECRYEPLAGLLKPESSLPFSVIMIQ